MKNNFSKTYLVSRVALFYIFTNLNICLDSQLDSYLLLLCNLVLCHSSCNFWKTSQYTCERMKVDKANNYEKFWLRVLPSYKPHFDASS